MKKSALVLTIVIVLGTELLIGCSKKNEVEKSEKVVTTKEFKKETKEALETAVAFTEQKKKEYQKKIEAKLKEYDKKIEILESRASELKEEGRTRFDQEIKELRKNKETVQKKLVELKRSSGKAWKDVKEGIDRALDKLDKSYNQARSYLK